MPKILVVDDDQEIRLLAGKYIRERGHDVFFAKDAFEAHDFLNKFPVDLVVLDVNMPHKNGFVFLSELRGAAKFRSLPVILMTARNEKKDLEKALVLGVVYYIVKPFARDSFVEQIEKYLPKSSWDKQEFFTFARGTEPVIAQATTEAELQILSVSDLVFNVVANGPYPVGSTISLTVPFLTSVGVDTIAFTVVGHEPYTKGRTILQLRLSNEQREAQSKLRNWLKNQARKIA